MKVIYFFKLIFKKINPYHFFALFILTLIAAIVTYANLGTTKEFIGDDAGVIYHYLDITLKNVFNMWDSYTFPGRANVIASIALLHVGSKYILDYLGLTSIFIDRIYYFLFYFVSSVGMYFLASHICNTLFVASKNKVWFASITGAMFYILNNLTMILLSFPPTNYIYSYMLLPWLFLLYIKDFHISNSFLKRFVIVVLFLFVLSGNPSNTISILSLLLFYEFFFRTNNKIIKNIKNIVISSLLLLLLSSYIYLPILGNKVNPYGKISSSDNKVSIAYSSSTTSIVNLLRFRGHPSQDNFSFSNFLLNNYTTIVNYLLIAFSLLFLFKKKTKRIEIFFLSTFILFFFLSKAEHFPFSWINRFIYDHVPLFEMYRASYAKFMYFCSFSLSIMISISILETEKFLIKHSLPFFIKKVFLVLPVLLIIFGATPFFWGKVVRNIHKTTIPVEYHSIKTYLNKIKVDFSILSLPQLSSGQVLDWGNGNYYAGFTNTDIYMLGRPAWVNSWFLSKPILSNNLIDYKKILNKSNVKYIILHKDVPENYSFEVNMKGYTGGQTNFRNLNKQIISDNDYRLISDTRYFKIFELDNNKYMPHVYIRKSINSFSKSAGDLPILEFKKINPTKYRIVIHGARGKFPIVFNESFHDQWKTYLADSQKLIKIQLSEINNYKILDGNTEDQASKEELKSFIDNGWISTLGDGKEKKIKHQKWADNKEKLDYVEKYNIDFISKNFQDTIQNDNLQSGPFYETLFKKSIDDNKNHLIANGYANSWNIDVNKLCNNNLLCIKNPDGSYDFEVVVEFWPQRLFYIGLIISGTTLLACIGYLIYDYYKRKRHISFSQ